MPGPIAHAVRSYLALLRGPVSTNAHAFANVDTTRAGITHKGLLAAWPSPASPGGADFGIQEQGGFSVDIADLPDGDRSVTRRADLYATLKTSIVPEIGPAPLAYSRNLAARVRDWEGRARLVPANCARFRGARVVQNLLRFPEDLSNAAFWTSLVGGTGSAPVITPGQPDPDGGNTAFRIQLNRGAGDTAADFSVLRQAVAVTNGVRSLYVRSNTGAAQTFSLVATSAAQIVTCDSTWKRLAGPVAPGTSSGQMDISNYGPLLTTRSVDILVWHPQLESVLGQSNQAPSEYVSRDVLSFPFHGAGVDGIKYFDYANQNSVNPTTRVVTEGGPPDNKRVAWATLPGRAGNYISAPDSAAVSVTGDIDIRVKLWMRSWLGTKTFVSKRQSAGQASYRFGINSGGGLFLETSQDGTVIPAAPNSVLAVPFAAFEVGYVRAIRVAATGFGDFFYSYDGVTWVSLTGSAGTAGNIFDSTSQVEIGSTLGGGTQNVEAGILSAQIHNGIDGPIVASFNAADFTAGGTTAVSSVTGETWTVNTTGTGNLARVEEAFTDATLDRLYGEPDATYRQVNTDFSTGFTTGGTTSRVQNALSPAGDLLGYTLGDTDATQQSFFRRQWTIANDGAGRLFGVLINKDAVTNRFPAIRSLISGGAGINHTVWLNSATGQNQPDAGNSGGQSWVYELADHWLVLTWIVNNTSGNTTAQMYVYPSAGSVIGTGNVATTGTVGACWMFMVEGLVNADPVEWIDASAGDVARPVDTLTYPKASLISDTAGTVYARAKAVTWRVAAIVGDSAAGFVLPLASVGSNGGAYMQDGTLAAYGPAGAPPANTRIALASHWGDGKMRVFAGGVGGAEVAYDGSMTIADVGIFRAAAGYDFHGCVGDLEIYKGIKWQAEHMPQLGAGQVTVSHVEAIAAGVPFSETPWGMHQSLGAALINQPCDLELVTQYTHEDGSTSESVHARRAVCKGWKKRKNVTTLNFTDLDMAALAQAYPSRAYDVAAFAELFDGHVGRKVTDGRGVVVKMPLTEIVKTGGTWKYGSVFYDAAVAVTVLAVYRDGRVVDPSEYTTGTLAAGAGGYTVRTIQFTREQIDPQGRRYDLQADLQIVGTTVRASDEVKRLITLAGQTPNAASFTAAETYGTTHKMWCDAAYVRGRPYRDIINDLLLICRADLVQNTAGEWVLVQDQTASSSGTFVETADLIEVEEYGLPEVPKTIVVEYRPTIADEERFNTPPRTRTTTGTGAEKRYKNPYLRQHESADRLCDYLAKRAAQPRARVRVYGLNMVKGEVITIVGNTAWQGAKDFVVDAITYGADSNLLDLREYSADVHTYTPATLPTDPTNGYSPDYSQTPPAAPTSLAVISQGATVEADGKITSHALIRAVPPSVNWAKLIIFVTDSGNNGVYQAELKLNAGNYEVTVPGLRPNQAHTVICQAVNANNVNGVATAPVGFTSANHTSVPATMSAPSVTQDSATCLRISWGHTALANRAGYILERSDNGGATWPELARLGKDTNHHLDNYVAVGFTYYYRVRQVDTSGNEGANSSAGAQTVQAWASSTHIVAAGILNGSMANNSIDRNQVVNSAISGAKTDVASSVNNFFGVTNGTVIQLTSNQGLWSTVDLAQFTCVGGGGPSNTRWRNDGGTTNVTAYENYWA